MEISEEKIEEMLARQADRVAQELENRMGRRFSKWNQSSDERMQRYIGSIQEDWDHKFDAVMEYVKDIPEIKHKLDITFDKVGELAVDMEIVKEALKNHEHRLQKLEARL